MQIIFDPQGRPTVSRYEIGDLVRLRTAETGENAMGQVGDWGAVIAVEGGVGSCFDIQLAGYSQPRTATLRRLTGLTRRQVVPCDRNGVPISLDRHFGVGKVDAGMTRRAQIR